MKKQVLLIVMLACMVLEACSNISAANHAAQQQNLKLSLSFEQTAYHVGEPVIAQISLENIGKKAILINSRMSVNLPFEASPIREIAFRITDPMGKSYWPNVNISPRILESQHFVELRPSEVFKTSCNLSSYSYKFTEVGEYRIIVNYQNFIDPNFVDTEDIRIAWKGEIDSNEVLLTIIP